MHAFSAHVTQLGASDAMTCHPKIAIIKNKKSAPFDYSPLQCDLRNAARPIASTVPSLMGPMVQLKQYCVELWTEEIAL